MSVAATFFASLKPAAIALYKATGILPSVSLAQAALESGYGTSSLATSNYNLFGIKGTGTAGTANLATTEYIDGVPVVVNAKFRAYNSWAESLADYGDVLVGSARYSDVIAAPDYEAATDALQTAGYATDPNYAAKLRSIIKTYGLDAYDTEAKTGTYTATPADVLKNIADRKGLITPDAADTAEAKTIWEKILSNAAKYAVILLGVFLALLGILLLFGQNPVIEMIKEE